MTSLASSRLPFLSPGDYTFIFLLLSSEAHLQVQVKTYVPVTVEHNFNVSMHQQQLKTKLDAILYLVPYIALKMYY